MNDAIHDQNAKASDMLPTPNINSLSSRLKKYVSAALASVVIQLLAIYCFCPNPEDFKPVSTFSGVDHSYKTKNRNVSYTATVVGNRRIYCLISIIGSSGGCGTLDYTQKQITVTIANYMSLIGMQEVVLEAKIGDRALVSNTPSELVQRWIDRSLC